MRDIYAPCSFSCKQSYCDAHQHADNENCEDQQKQHDKLDQSRSQVIKAILQNVFDSRHQFILEDGATSNTKTVDTMNNGTVPMTLETSGEGLEQGTTFDIGNSVVPQTIEISEENAKQQESLICEHISCLNGR